LAQGGRARLPTRFAADWLKFGSDGRLVKGDSTRNENWYGYREPLLAVAAGTVVEAKDGIPENKARSDPVVPITIANVTGNHVVLDLGDGWHALYAHLSTGSVKVKRGDRVQAGQEIGRLGDSGGSDTPHLHFELSDGLPSAGAEGAPFVLESFEHLDTLTDLGRIFRDPWTPKPGMARTRRGELPLDNWVVRFP
jgi:murein DD-endopeptidase MepM/ murein hydrolase activator NlpD